MSLPVFISILMLGTTSCETPSDDDVQAAYQAAYALPEGSPEREKALEAARKMEARKKAADAAVETAGHALDFVFPGLGALAGIAYGVWQRQRSNKRKDMLSATFEAIEEFKSWGGGDAAAALIAKLKEKHDEAGVREAVKAALAELKREKIKKQ